METTTKATEKVQASKGNKEATRLAAKAMPRPRHQQGGASLANLDFLSLEAGITDSKPSGREDGLRAIRQRGGSWTEGLRADDKVESATGEEARDCPFRGATLQKAESHVVEYFCVLKRKQ